jgi:hypothetical protein
MSMSYEHIRKINYTGFYFYTRLNHTKRSQVIVAVAVLSLAITGSFISALCRYFVETG